MKLKDEFVTVNSGDTQIMVSIDTRHFSGMIRSNPSAAFIVDCLKEETDEEKILEQMKEHFDGPEDLMKEDICLVLEKLRSVDALDE